jgi:hypothetical protein
MELTYENVVNFFDGYIKAFNKYAGPLETVPNMLKYYTPDFEWWSYGRPSVDRKPTSRDYLLMTMVHPGIHEELTPRQFIVDLKQMVCVVQFQYQWTDERTGTIMPPGEASAHYTFVLDENKDLKIKKLQYWTTGSLPATDGKPSILDLARQYREEVLVELATSWMKAPHKTFEEVKAKP